MKLRIILAAWALGMLLTTGGCIGRAIGEGVGKVTGPKGFSVENKTMTAQDEASFSTYTNFQLVPMTDDTSGHAPRAFFSQLPYEFDKVLTERKLPAGKGKTLLIRGKVIYYEDASMASQLFGPLEEVIAHVQFVDKATGAVIGEATCVGRSTQTVNMGTTKKAEGMARAIAGWIEYHYRGKGR